MDLNRPGRRDEPPLPGDATVLEMIASGVPLHDILTTLIQTVEAQSPGMMGSILLIEDGLRIKHGAAPSLPPDYIKAIDGEPIGPGRGSCGTAAYLGEMVIVEDITTDPRWQRYRQVALDAGLRACWSTPICAHDGSVIGTFAFYYAEPRRPLPEELELIRHGNHLAAIAIERDVRISAIVESETFARSVVDNALDAHVTMDAAGLVTGWSSRAVAIFGWTAREAIGVRLSELIIPLQHRASHEEGLQRYHATGHGVVLGRRLELTALHKSGREFPVELTVSPIHRGGRVVFSAFVADISARKQAEKALEAAREHLSLVYQHVDDVLFQLDVEPGDYRFVSVNPAFEKATGLAANLVVGRSVRDIIPEPSLSIVLARYDEAIRTGRTIRWEETTTYPTGVRHGEVAITPVFDAHRRATSLVGSVRDLTEWRRLEEDNRQLQKMEAIGRLTGGVAHDFNNLLTVILGYGDLISRELSDRPRLQADLQEIVNAGRRASALTNQLLAFARKQTLQPRLIDLNVVVGGLEKLLRRLIPENIDIRTILSADLLPVLADPGQIEQVIINVSVNARDAIDGTGCITIETGNVELGEETVRVHGDVAAGLYVMLTITDTGSGMDAETQQRIFEPFFTTKEKGAGTGLGLATVYGIVKQSGGHLWVDTEPGRGTAFKICLPWAGVDTDEFDLGPEAPARLVGDRSVLLVEDEEALRGLCQRMLTDLGYQVQVAANGAEAIDAVEARGLEPELLITDIIMPGMTGNEVFEHLRAKRPHLRVLYMSGYTDVTIGHQGRLLPGTPFLRKPFTISELAVAAQEALKG